MLKFVFVTLCLVSSLIANGQYELDTPDYTPIVNSDSLAEILLNDFIGHFNKHEIDFSELLKNQYTFLTLVLKDRVGLQFLEEASLIEEGIGEFKSLHRSYKRQQKIIVKQKRHQEQFSSKDFKLIDANWSIGGSLEDFEKSVAISFKNVDDSSNLNEILFLVLFHDNTAGEYICVTKVH